MRRGNIESVEDRDDIPDMRIQLVRRGLVRFVTPAMATGVEQDKPVMRPQGFDIPMTRPTLHVPGHPVLQNQSRSLPLYAIVDSDALVGREWHGILTPSWPSVGSLGELPLSISVFDHDVSALDVTEITQSLTKGLGQVGATGQAARQVAYSSDLRRRLCLR